MMEWVEYMTSAANSPMANLRRQNGRDKPWKVTYFAVGNESWGCGGGMTPEFYADQFRRYNTFVKNYGSNRLYRVACGPNGDGLQLDRGADEQGGPADERPRRCITTRADGQLDGSKGSATQFTEAEYLATLRGALRNGGVVAKHAAIMDKYDPQKRIGLVVDEWGVWTDVEPGSNPGFLYQQNSLRDALVAGAS